MDESTPRPSWLGRSEAELREEFGSGLQPEKIEARRSPTSLIAISPTAPAGARSEKSTSPALEADPKDPFAEQKRLVARPELDGVTRIEFELFRDRVYRVRWRLTEKFERPLMPSIVERLSADLGDAYYDQTIEGKFGTGRATLRRSAWRNDGNSLEIRQLTPMLGGPTFITVSDLGAVQAIVASGGKAAPEPDSIGTWWEKPVKPLPPLTTQERDALMDAFHAVLAQVGWGH